MNKETGAHISKSPVKENEQPFGMRDKIGYMSGDIANNLTFQFSSLFYLKKNAKKRQKSTSHGIIKS